MEGALELFNGWSLFRGLTPSMVLVAHRSQCAQLLAVVVCRLPAELDPGCLSCILSRLTPALHSFKHLAFDHFGLEGKSAAEKVAGVVAKRRF